MVRLHGKEFVKELARLFRAYGEGSSLECIALKAVTVASVLLLQRLFPRSKSRDHVSCLKGGWSVGLKVASVTCSRKVGNHFKIPKGVDARDKDSCLARSFSNLMFQGKIKDAIRLLLNCESSGVLELDAPIDHDDPNSGTVLAELKKKHPAPGPPSSLALLPLPPNPPPSVHPVIFESIDATCIRSAAVHTFGAGGPSSLDAHCWRRLCTSFKKAFDVLCHSLSLVAKWLCTTFVDPHALAPFLACRLIALDKHPGVRPIGICEVPRQIIAKAVISVVRGDVLEAMGVHQVCAGQIAGVESAIHAVRQCFEDSGSEGVLLIDALNAFNYLNRKSALVHVCFLCPLYSTVLINCY